jgi:1-acyl-sn-glycerol-3-phosphate acyltransferase
MMRGIFRWYMDFMRGIGILVYNVENAERLASPGSVIVANHPCLLDIVFLIAQTPNATCIVKPALAANPFLRIPIRAIGYIYAEHSEALLERCAEELREGGSLIIFPEGTRTTPGEALKFQRGAAAIALHSGATVVPALLSCTPTTLTKREKWYQIPAKKFTLSLRVERALVFQPAPESAARPLITRMMTRQMEQYFIEQQKLHEKQRRDI